MFPTQVDRASPATRIINQAALPLALFLWLLPLLGVAMTSLKPFGDLAAGNYFGFPSHLAFENYADVFNNSPLELADFLHVCGRQFCAISDTDGAGA